jgi:hypothetical protein
MTLAVVIGPLGLLVAGQSLQHVSTAAVFLAIAAGFTIASIAFAAALMRGEVSGSAEAAAVQPPAA